MVKVEFWIPDAAKDDVKAAVHAIVTESTRGPALVRRSRRSPLIDPSGVKHPMDAVIETAWTVPAIKAALDASDLVREGELSLRVVEGAEPVLLATMHEYGDLPIYLSVGGSQIVVSVLLWPVAEQADTAVSGEDVYELMGELSCKTTLQTILIELRTLAENAIDATGLRDTFGAEAA